MKKTLIVAAVSALAAGSALAQSSVTIYGRLNVSAEQQKNIGAVGSQKVLQNSASRLGFKGTEDLGGGLKANFILESGFSPDTGAAGAPFWGRQSEVNLEGKFGMVRLGNFTSEAYYATADYISLHNHDTGTSEDKLYAYIGRNTIKIAYRLPEFVKGLSVEGGASATEGAAASRYRNFDGAINYTIGAIQLGAGGEKNGPSNQFALRGLYDGGAFLVGAYIQRHKDEFAGDRTVFRVSGAYMLGASEFHANFGNSSKFSKVAGSKASQFTLGYNYNLSKRTKVYAFYTKVDNGTVSYFGATGAGGKPLDPNALAAGLRHNF